MKTEKIKRVEVINHSGYGKFGRAFTLWEDYIVVTLSLQDDDKTLKIFIDREEEDVV